MVEWGTSHTLVAGITLLERSVGYALGSLMLVTPESLCRPTPCPCWDLADLLVHMNDSLAALQEAAELGTVSLYRESGAFDTDVNLVKSLRDRACQLMGSWTSGREPDATFVGGSPVSTSVLAAAGALEVAVHGWDVSRACGSGRDLPDELADELLECAHLLVGVADRPVRFATVVDVPHWASPSERLVAFLGRQT